MRCHRYDFHTSRRELLQSAGCGFGALALAALESNAAQSAPLPHHAGPGRRTSSFCSWKGAPAIWTPSTASRCSTNSLANPCPTVSSLPLTAAGEAKSPLLECRRTWRQHGDSGLWISDWFPRVAQHADDLTVIHSCVSNGINHAGGVCQMNTGSIFGGRPSLGAWASYGLGTENENLPAFVVIKDSGATVVNGVRNWGSGFMPAAYQGIEFKSDGTPVKFLDNPKGVDRQAPARQARPAGRAQP